MRTLEIPARQYIPDSETRLRRWVIDICLWFIAALLVLATPAMVLLVLQ